MSPFQDSVPTIKFAEGANRDIIISANCFIDVDIPVPTLNISHPLLLFSATVTNAFAVSVTKQKSRV